MKRDPLVRRLFNLMPPAGPRVVGTEKIALTWNILSILLGMFPGIER